MRRKPFGVRFTDEEMRKLKLAAQARGWSVGRYIRFRSLGEERELDQRVSALEKRVGK